VVNYVSTPPSVFRHRLLFCTTSYFTAHLRPNFGVYFCKDNNFHNESCVGVLEKEAAEASAADCNNKIQNLESRKRGNKQTVN